MLSRYLEDLQHSIQWAQFEDDLDVLNLARCKMEEAMSFIAGLNNSQQQQSAYRQLDNLLPMEWPIWMEACRYGDQANGKAGLIH